MTAALLTAIFLALFAVALVVGGFYLIVGTGPAMMLLGAFVMVAAVIAARGALRA